MQEKNKNVSTEESSEQGRNGRMLHVRLKRKLQRELQSSKYDERYKVWRML